MEQQNKDLKTNQSQKKQEKKTQTQSQKTQNKKQEKKTQTKKDQKSQEKNQSQNKKVEIKKEKKIEQTKLETLEIKHIRFCDFMVEQIKAFPMIDFRYSNEMYSKSFHRNLQLYRGWLTLQGFSDENTDENLQREINLWHRITKDFGQDVFKITSGDKYKKFVKILATYRVEMDVDPNDNDRMIFKEIKKTTPEKLLSTKTEVKPVKEKPVEKKSTKATLVTTTKPVEIDKNLDAPVAADDEATDPLTDDNLHGSDKVSVEDMEAENALAETNA